MLNKKTFGEYINHYRTNREYPLNYSQLAEELGLTCTFVTNVENKGKHFSDKILELFADKFKLDEIEFGELLLQRAIDQYTGKKGKKTLKNIKKLLPFYKKMLDGEIDEGELEKVTTLDPVSEICKQIDRIDNPKLREFLRSDIDYAVKRFGE